MTVQRRRLARRTEQKRPPAGVGEPAYSTVQYSVGRLPFALIAEVNKLAQVLAFARTGRLPKLQRPIGLSDSVAKQTRDKSRPADNALVRLLAFRRFVSQ